VAALPGSINSKTNIVMGYQRVASETEATVGVAVTDLSTCSVLALARPLLLTALKMAEQINMEKKRATM